MGVLDYKLTLDGGHDWNGVPVGVDEADLAGVVDGDDVDALEGDGFAVFGVASSGPFDGGGVAGDEDAVFGEAGGVEEREDARDEGVESCVAVEGWGADWVVAGGGGGEGGDPAVGVHCAGGGEVFGNGCGYLVSGVWHRGNCTCE
jgi:hypothetical protein